MFKSYSDSTPPKPDDASTSQTVEPPLKPIAPIPPRPQPAAPAWDPNAFVLDMRNLRFVQGKARQVAGNGWGIAALFGLVLIGLAVAAMIPSLIKANALASRGTTTAATITNAFVTTTSGRYGPNYHYNVSFRFVDKAKRVFTVDQEVSNDTYNRLKAGQQVMVLYDVANPTVAQLSGKDRDDTTYNADLLRFLLLGVPGGLIIALGLGMMFRTRIVQHKSRILKGTIIGASSHTHRRSGFVVSIRFQVVSPTGETLVRNASATRNDLRRKPLPRIGTPIYVAYVNDTMFRAL